MDEEHFARMSSDERDNSKLIPELIGHEDHRMVGVIKAGWEEGNLQEGDKKHFTVGKSNGRAPIHLSIHSARSMGGSPLYLDEFLSVFCKTCGISIKN